MDICINVLIIRSRNGIGECDLEREKVERCLLSFLLLDVGLC